MKYSLFIDSVKKRYNYIKLSELIELIKLNSEESNEKIINDINSIAEKIATLRHVFNIKIDQTCWVFELVEDDVNLHFTSIDDKKNYLFSQVIEAKNFTIFEYFINKVFCTLAEFNPNAVNFAKIMPADHILSLTDSRLQEQYFSIIRKTDSTFLYEFLSAKRMLTYCLPDLQNTRDRDYLAGMDILIKCGYTKDLLTILLRNNLFDYNLPLSKRFELTDYIITKNGVMSFGELQYFFNVSLKFMPIESGELLFTIVENLISKKIIIDDQAHQLAIFNGIYPKLSVGKQKKIKHLSKEIIIAEKIYLKYETLFLKKLKDKLLSNVSECNSINEFLDSTECEFDYLPARFNHEEPPSLKFSAALVISRQITKFDTDHNKFLSNKPMNIQPEQATLYNLPEELKFYITAVSVVASCFMPVEYEI